LVREWTDWCVPHYTTDPDNFLGRNTSYLLSVLLESDPDRTRDREWKLLILEDAGELLAPDARVEVGQGLSRFLNVTDGLIGQGMKALVLVTTNEPLRKLHPAVARPGRCLAEVEFTALSVEEANAWLQANGSNVRVDRPTPIAELYSVLAGREPEAKGVIGFAA
jgi:hypothetical protein